MRVPKRRYSSYIPKQAVCAIAIMLSAAWMAGCRKGSPGETGVGATASTAPATLNIAVIPKGTTHVYWRAVHAGADSAAHDFGVNIVWKGPVLENDRAQQIAIVEQFVSEGIDGIVVAPLDNVALKRPIDDAMNRHIPVVIFDSSLQGDVGTDFVSFVATDNKHGGEMAGDELARLLDNKGKIVLLRYGEGSASTLDREAGFLDVISKHPDMQMLVQNRYAGPTSGDAQNTALQMADQLRQADGIFASNESAATGMLLALRKLGLNGKVKFVGFDSSDKLLEGLNDGDIDALVLQNPKMMAYLAVQQCVNALHSQPVTAHIDSGAGLLTRQNINTPEMQKLLEVK
jgi:ribose transport system substrate-binding protein